MVHTDQERKAAQQAYVAMSPDAQLVVVQDFMKANQNADLQYPADPGQAAAGSFYEIQMYQQAHPNDWDFKLIHLQAAKGETDESTENRFFDFVADRAAAAAGGDKIPTISTTPNADRKPEGGFPWLWVVGGVAVIGALVYFGKGKRKR